MLLTWYWREEKRRDDQVNKRDEHLLAYESGIAGRFTKAAELLANVDLMARTAGLFALWDIARESSAHRPTVNRTIAAYVRERAPRAIGLKQERGRETVTVVKPKPPKPDVQNALTILADSHWSQPDWHSNGARIEADLRLTELSLVHLPGVNLSRTILARARLIYANLSLSNLVEAELSNANLVGANLVGSNLTNASLYESNLRSARLNDAKLCGAKLSGAILCEALLAGADLSGASLVQADLTRASLESANLKGADLTRANLIETNLGGANLVGADLASAAMNGAILRDALYDSSTKLPHQCDPAAEGMRLISTQRT